MPPSSCQSVPFVSAIGNRQCPAPSSFIIHNSSFPLLPPLPHHPTEPLLGAVRVPVPKTIREPNRCNLEPFKPEPPKIALYLVFPRARLTLQVVCPGPVDFRLPARPPKNPCRPTRDNPGRPGGGRLAGGWRQAPQVASACSKAARVFFCKLLEHQTEGWGWFSMVR